MGGGSESENLFVDSNRSEQLVGNLNVRYGSDVRVVSNKALVDFSAHHTGAGQPLQLWRKLIETGSYSTFADLKNVFNTVDKVGDLFVFNIGGNKFRVIAAIHFNRQTLFIRHVFTHAHYDRWRPAS